MFVTFHIKNSEGKEVEQIVDIDKAKILSYKLEMKDPDCWRLGKVSY